MDRARAAPVRAHRRHRQLLLHRRSGSRSSASCRTRAGTAISSTPSTEFFSDYGVYDVSLTVPRGWMVGATGVERERRDNADGTTTHRYYQEDVHDFAWTTSPDYLERTARFEHPTLPPVEMRLLLQPEHAAQAERHFDATRHALKYYGEWFGAVSVRPHHHRRSRLSERRRRHGVPDAVHRRHALARAGAA